MNKVTFTMKRKIYDHLVRVVSKDDNGFCHFMPQVSDETIAAAHNVGMSVVRKIRQDEFGKLRGSTVSASGELNARVTQIEEYLTSKNPNWKG